MDSTKPPRPDNPELFWHATGRWAKKILGKLHYFGRGTYEQAIVLYRRQASDLHAGRVHREADGDTDMQRLASRFLATKNALLEAGELSPRTYEDYLGVCDLLLDTFGERRQANDLGPRDFENLRQVMAERWGPVRVGNFVNMVRVVFRYGSANGLLERLPVFGEGFRRPTKKTLRQHRQKKGGKMFEAAEILAMLKKARQPLRTMILLGVNCGMGNSDVSRMPITAVDLKTGWLDYPRPKTGIERRVPLWPETVKGLREWLRMRPVARRADDAGLVFVTKYGASWAVETGGNPVSKETAKLLKQCGITGRNFYGLRHTFQTIGDESGDFIAVRKIMGHASSDIADEYRERVSDTRLQKVVEFVRSWTFAARRKTRAV